MKGLSEPIEVFELSARQKVQGRFEAIVRRGLAPLIGRNPEFQQLLQAWQQTKQGRGRVVSLIGEAGMGGVGFQGEFIIGAGGEYEAVGEREARARFRAPNQHPERRGTGARVARPSDTQPNQRHGAPCIQPPIDTPEI